MATLILFIKKVEVEEFKKTIRETAAIAIKQVLQLTKLDYRYLLTV